MKTKMSVFIANDIENNLGISRKEIDAIEDVLLGIRAKEALKHGYWLGVKASEAYIRKLLHARD
jgi:hypothetical protein